MHKMGISRQTMSPFIQFFATKGFSSDFITLNKTKYVKFNQTEDFFLSVNKYGIIFI